jgi:hypothetical protein
MTVQRVAFGAVAGSVAILAAIIGNLPVGLSVFVPVAYAGAEEIAKPYPDHRYHPLVGIVSIASFCALVAAVAIFTPSSDEFETAWYGYVVTSVLYALSMWSAPSRSENDGWMGRVHLYAAYVTLITAIAFSCAIPVRIAMESDDFDASFLAVTGALLSALLDGCITAAWFFSASNLEFSVRGRIFGIGFVLAVAGMFGDETVTTSAGMVAGVLMLVTEFAIPIDRKLRTYSLVARAVPLVVSIASTWRSHAFGLAGSGATAVLGLITAAYLVHKSIGPKNSLEVELDPT